MPEQRGLVSIFPALKFSGTDDRRTSLHQFFNGWCQNIDAYTHNPRLGKYFNLDQCS